MQHFLLPGGCTGLSGQGYPASQKPGPGSTAAGMWKRPSRPASASLLHAAAPGDPYELCSSLRKTNRLSDQSRELSQGENRKIMLLFDPEIPVLLSYPGEMFTHMLTELYGGMFMSTVFTRA